VLRRHPGVADVAIVGVDDAEWGQVVTAHVVPRDPAVPVTLDDLRTLVAEELPAFHAPRRLVLTTAIPRTALGKPKRGVLTSDPD
jgi:acyl-CoA synthetase (AMP-forming)/AMP-acid ligase II